MANCGTNRPSLRLLFSPCPPAPAPHQRRVCTSCKGRGGADSPCLAAQNFDPYETDEQGNLVVHVTIRATCRHTDDLELESHMFGGTEEDILFPTEWVTTHWTNTDPPTLEKYVSRQMLDIDGCSTGGLCGVPGFLFAMGQPLPPPLTELLAPIPPATAADNRDPNFKMRIQVFKQIVKRDDAKKTTLKELIGMQQREIQQHMDYLNSIRNYL
uniref:Uncharacterized protein n=1 Tax=Hemiselmis andersenii TaxID=464988 RepID=A0A7S1E9E7_HEMAN|mmetsp:Transcript_39140/g.95140  ORF Transcript_39140/g.95140 Transcript_39140/m.95140 type:complete len:213 (+) Transcript_39140:365-1003(+)